MFKDWVTWEVTEFYSDDLWNQWHFLYSFEWGQWEYVTCGNLTDLVRPSLPVWLFDYHLNKNEDSYSVGYGQHQFYLTPENSQVCNLKGNWFVRRYVWVAYLWNFESFKTGAFKGIKENNQTLVHCVNNHDLYGKVVIMYIIFFFSFRCCSKWLSKY